MTPTLPYDSSPIPSTLQRQNQDGALIITIPAGPPDARALNSARLHTAFTAALFAFAALFLMLMISRAFLQGLTARPAWWVNAIYTIFGGAIFLLLWITRYQRRRDALHRAWQTHTAIAITLERILIESATTAGPISREIPLSQVLHTEIHGAGFLAGTSILPRLVIFTKNPPSAEILLGRHDQELDYVANEIAKARRKITPSST